MTPIKTTTGKGMQQPRTAPPRGEPILQVTDVGVNFGGIKALKNASFQVQQDEICGLIGPNGAGKTTLFNTVSGLVPIDTGQIHFQGRRIDNMAPHRIISTGICRTFQNVGLYPDMTVLQNVQLGGHYGSQAGFLATALGLPRARREERELRDRAMKHLADIGLESFAQRRTGDLPYGTLKRIEIARALMSSPKLLMLDEPAGGLSHGEVSELGAMLRRLRTESGMTLLVVEHHMRLVMELCTHVVVLSQGMIIADGTPEQVQANEDVIAVYLGAPA